MPLPVWISNFYCLPISFQSPKNGLFSRGYFYFYDQNGPFAYFYEKIQAPAPALVTELNWHFTPYAGAFIRLIAVSEPVQPEDHLQLRNGHVAEGPLQPIRVIFLAPARQYPIETEIISQRLAEWRQNPCALVG